MFNKDFLDIEEHIFINDQDYSLDNKISNSIAEYRLNSFLEDYNEEKEKIEINHISYNMDQNLDVNSTLNIQSLITSNDFIINDYNRELFFNKKDEIIFNKLKEIPHDTIFEQRDKKIEEDKHIEKKIIKFIPIKEKKEKLYRKDYYYKHFKSLFGKYLKNYINNLKNICFPYFSFNNFSTPSYSFIGNTKELDNCTFLSWKIKDILIYKGKNKGNRQYNNKVLLEFIEKNGQKTKDKNAYKELINYLNKTFENALLDFYEDKNEFNIIKQDKDCIFYDNFFKKETGISLLEKNGFLEIIKKNKYNNFNNI